MDKEKIELDIKLLKNISECFTYSLWSDDTEALRRVLNYIQQLETKVKELEEVDLTTVYLDGVYDGQDKGKERIKELEKEIKKLEFYRKADAQVHEYDVKMIDEVKGEVVKQWKRIKELEEEKQKVIDYIEKTREAILGEKFEREKADLTRSPRIETLEWLTNTILNLYNKGDNNERD